MSKRFIDYYLDAVTKKSGGGGGYPEPTGTINITSNGTHNVKDKATANVNVPQPSLGQLNEIIQSNGAVDFDPSDYGYDGFDSVDITVNVPSGGGGAEIIIPDNSLGAYIEGEGEPMDAQSVVNWYDYFDPTQSVPCTFQGVTPSVDDKVLLTGDVVSILDFSTVVGRYAIWGVCSSPYDGIGITFSDALGYSVVDSETPMNATTITAENDTGASVIEAYTNESGSQQLAVDIRSGGGGSSNIVTGEFTANSVSGAQTINIPYSGNGYPVGGLVYCDEDLDIDQRYSFWLFSFSKVDPSITPTYPTGTGYDTTNGAYGAIVTRNNTAATLSSSSFTASSYVGNLYHDTDATSSSNTTKVRLKNATTLSMFVRDVNGTGVGLLPGAKYKYIIEYSE